MLYLHVTINFKIHQQHSDSTRGILLQSRDIHVSSWERANIPGQAAFGCHDNCCVLRASNRTNQQIFNRIPLRASWAQHAYSQHTDSHNTAPLPTLFKTCGTKSTKLYAQYSIRVRDQCKPIKVTNARNTNFRIRFQCKMPFWFQQLETQQ